MNAERLLDATGVNWIKDVAKKNPDGAKVLKAAFDQYGGLSGLFTFIKLPDVQEKLKVWFEDEKRILFSREDIQSLIETKKIELIAKELSAGTDVVAEGLAEVLPPILKKMYETNQSISLVVVFGKVGKAIKRFFGG